MLRGDTFPSYSCLRIRVSLPILNATMEHSLPSQHSEADENKVAFDAFGLMSEYNLGAVDEYRERFSQLPDLLSGELSEEEFEQYRKRSDSRWSSLRKTLVERYGETVPDNSELVSWVKEKLVRFAQLDNRLIKQFSGVANLPADYKSMFAAMFWKYLWGVSPAEINRVASGHNEQYRYSAPGSVVRSVFVSSIAVDEVAGLEEIPDDKTSTRKGGVAEKIGEISASQALVMANKAVRKRDAHLEKAHIPPNRNKKVDSKADWSRLALSLGKALHSPGDKVDEQHAEGVLRSMFGLMPEVLITPEQKTAVEQNLFKLIVNNIAMSRAGRLLSEECLDRAEVYWAAHLCGKKLAVQNQHSVFEDIKALTVPNILNRVYLMRRNTTSHDKMPPTADEVEKLLQRALQKLVVSSKRH